MHIAITDYVLEVVQNAFEANSTNTRLMLQETAEAISVTVADNGKGMSEEVMKRVLDPFSTEEGKHPLRKVGLGLSFLSQATELAGGKLTLQSEVGVGTTVHFTFDPASIRYPAARRCGVDVHDPARPPESGIAGDRTKNGNRRIRAGPSGIDRRAGRP